MNWSSRKKKEAFFVRFILSEGIFFNIFLLSQCVLNIHFQNIHTFTEYKYFYDEVTYYFYRLLNLLAMVLILQYSGGGCYGITFRFMYLQCLSVTSNTILHNLSLFLFFIIYLDCECFYLSDTNLLRTSITVIYSCALETF